MRFFKNQRGMAIIEALLALLALGLIVFVGYRWYLSNYSKQQSNNSQSKQSSASQPASQQSQPTDHYLNITQWGVRFKLKDAYTDIYYNVQDQSDGSFAYFSLHSLDVPAPDCAPDKTSQTALGRYTKGSANLLVNESVLITIGNYDYTWGLGQAPCAPIGSAAETTVNNLRSDFKSMVESLELIT